MESATVCHIHKETCREYEVSNDLVNWKKAGLIQTGEESGASVEMNINDNTTWQFFRARRRE